jgi:phosphoenolpyruvate-protein kinase (PTS system EI component)
LNSPLTDSTKKGDKNKGAAMITIQERQSSTTQLPTVHVAGQKFKVDSTPHPTRFILGKAFNLKQPSLPLFQKTFFSVINTTTELAKLTKAINDCKQELLTLYESTKMNNPKDVYDIFLRQYYCLDDSAFLNIIINILVREKVNVENLLANQISYLDKIKKSTYDQDQLTSLTDRYNVCYRLLSLLAKDMLHLNLALKTISGPVILFTDRLTPSLLALLNIDSILALILEENSPAASTRIALQALPIPSLNLTPGTCALVHDGDMVLVDSLNCEIVIRPLHKDVPEHDTNRRRGKKSYARRR